MKNMKKIRNDVTKVCGHNRLGVRLELELKRTKIIGKGTEIFIRSCVASLVNYQECIAHLDFIHNGPRVAWQLANSSSSTLSHMMSAKSVY